MWPFLKRVFSLEPLKDYSSLLDIVVFGLWLCVMLISKYPLFYLIFTSLWSQYYYYLHCIEEYNKDQTSFKAAQSNAKSGCEPKSGLPQSLSAYTSLLGTLHLEPAPLPPKLYVNFCMCVVVLFMERIIFFIRFSNSFTPLKHWMVSWWIS